MLFPIDVDGLCRDLKRPGVRPQIWINRSLGHHRRRFTIAHEIGHVIIPWHTGTIVDDLDADDPSEHSDYFHMEGEANRFAAELLMPRAWAESICQRAEHLRDAMHAIAQGAEVSLFAAALRTTQVGPPGYIVAGVTDEFVTWVGKTKGTRGRPPHHAQHVSTIDMVAYGDPELLSYGPTTYYWWKELEGVPAPPKPLEPWREILSRVLTVVPSSERKKTQMQLNAIIGYAIGKLPKGTPVDQLYMRALEGLQNRSDYNPYVVAARHHPDFHDYVLARVHERAEAR
jgi:Zn-dependent peptidase ImmA (M78 family)